MSLEPEFSQRGRGRSGLDAGRGQGREAQFHAQFSVGSLVSSGELGGFPKGFSCDESAPGLTLALKSFTQGWDLSSFLSCPECRDAN